MQQQTTTSRELKEPIDASLIYGNSAEPLNVTSLQTNDVIIENSKFSIHLGSGFNNNKSFVNDSMSVNNRIFVIGLDGKPLSPCKSSKARKLLVGGVAKVVWNKFGLFGIQLLIPTRKFVPKTVLGIDNGTKFEGYSLICGKENNLNVMWLLPNKKIISEKLEERRHMRRARRWRNCRRREARFDNRTRPNGFIAPSQLVLVNSRLKAINEFFKSYPINKVAIEDVKFNHRDNRWGKNFSTVEIGKTKIKDFIIDKVSRDGFYTFEGYETQNIRKGLGLKKSSHKDYKHFNSHCVDSFAIASSIADSQIHNEYILVIDDTYRPIRRRLHDTQFRKGGIRDKYSTGNFKGIKKGTICEFGQIVGGTKNSFFIRNSENKRIGRTHIGWFSHQFKIKKGIAIPPTTKVVGFFATNFYERS
jgi:hypothetical protein